MLLRSFLSLLLVFGLANTASLSDSTVQVQAGQQVEWYNNAQADKITRTYSYFGHSEVIQHQHYIQPWFNQVNRAVANLISVKLKSQKQFLSQQIGQFTPKTAVPLYPAEDSPASSTFLV